MQIGDKIKLLRTENQLTQNDLAKKLNVSSQAISNWERHKGYPDIDNIINISDMFDVSLDELIKDDIDFKERLMSRKFEDGLDIIKNALFIILGVIGLVNSIFNFVMYGFEKVSIFILLVALFMLIDAIIFFKNKKNSI